MENKKAFGEYIRQKRMEAGLTQRNFADRLYVTESAVSKWERGLSYPDITLLSSICEILQVSEHELLTASEDVESRSMEKLAERYLALINRVKLIQYLLYGTALLVCFICNLAVSHTLSWFFVVLTSELTAASLTLLPVLTRKKRGLKTLCAFTGTLLLLLMTCCLYTGGAWFFLAAVPTLFGMCVIFLPYVLSQIWLPAFLERHKALFCMAVDTALLFLLLFVCDACLHGGWFLTIACPIAGFCMILPWGMLLLLRYTKMNSFFKTAACFGLSALFFYFLNVLLSTILDGKAFDVLLPLRFDFRCWSESMINANVNAIIYLAFFLCAFLFLFAGIAADLRRKNTH